MKIRSIHSVGLSLVVALALGACGGDGVGDTSAARSSGSTGASGEAARSAAGTPAGDPVQLAAEGEELFQQKGCNACHKFGEGRLVGPDLLGVTERREKAWIKAMIQKPDSMLQNDSTAKALLAEYYTPMQNVGVTSEQAEALYHYLRRRTEQAEASEP